MAQPTIRYVDPLLTSDGAGTVGDPGRLAQIAAWIAASTELRPVHVRILESSVGVGGAKRQSYGAGAVVEIGTILNVGCIAAVIEGDPNRDNPVILTAGDGVAASDWGLVPTSSAVFQTLLTDAQASAIEAVWQDYYGQAPGLWSPSGETDISRKRALVNEEIAENTNTAKAGLSEGAYGTIAVGDGTTWLVVHAWGDVDVDDAGDYYISLSNARPSPGTFHHRAAISVLESQHLTIRDLHIDRFVDDAGGSGVRVLNSTVAGGGAALGELRIERVQVNDFTQYGVAAGTSEAGAAQSVLMRDLVVGGMAIGSSVAGSAVRVDRLSATPAYQSIGLQRLRIGAHRVLGGDGAAAIDGGDVENQGILVDANQLKGGCQNVALSSVFMRGAAGACDDTVALDLRMGGDPASGREWDWKAYPCRCSDFDFADLPQLFFDNPIAMRGVKMDLTSDDEKSTASGSIDIGSNSVKVLLEGARMRVRENAGSPQGCITMSDASEVRIALSDIVDAAEVSDEALFFKNITTAANTLHCRSSVFRSESGGRFADLGDDTFSVDRCRFDANFTTLSFYRGETTGSIAKGSFTGNANVTRSAVDVDFAGVYESDNLTPKPNSPMRRIVDWDQRLRGHRGFGPGLYDGRPGSEQRGELRR